MVLFWITSVPAAPVSVATLAVAVLKLNVVPPPSATSVFTPVKFSPEPTWPALAAFTVIVVPAGAVRLSLPPPV